jgi:exopolysaccharide biosynthesis polyprenyl glycosylphosphotransferase
VARDSLRNLLTPVRASLSVERVLRAALPLFDSVGLIVGFLVGYLSLEHFPLVPQEPSPPRLSQELPLLLPTLILHWLCLLAVFFFARLYHQRRALSRIDQTSTIFAAISIGVILTSGLSTFFFKNSLFDIDYPRQLVLYVWLCTLVAIIAEREVHRQLVTSLRRAGLSGDRVLIIGSGETAQTIVRQIASRPELGYYIVGVVNGQNSDVRGDSNLPIVGTADQLPDLIDQHAIDDVIVALPDLPREELTHLIALCQRGRVSIKIYPDLFAYMAGGISVDDLGGMPLLTVRDMPMRGWKLSLKRGLDVVGALIGLVFLAPLMLLTAILIKLESSGPAFFCQERTGLDGRPFPMIKFRTMRSDSEAEGPGWTVKDDPRVTQLGRWMRANNWDEITNLINVLLGQMSLVGPRPEQTHFVEMFKEHIPRYMERHREKAGMTGWAQVNGYRGDTSIEERTKYDLYYVENWSIWFDIKIIIRTIVQTLLRRNTNAY